MHPFVQACLCYNHIKSFHNKTRDIKCLLCDYSTCSNSSMKMHIRCTHLKMKSIQCGQCSNSFSTKANLEVHIKRIHGKISDLKCMHCPEVFKVRVDLVKHVGAIHLKQFQCNICDKTLSSMHNLNKHTRAIHGGL